MRCPWLNIHPPLFSPSVSPQHVRRQGEVRSRNRFFLDTHHGATDPTGVLGAVPPKQPDSVRREVPSGIRRVDDAAHAGSYSCEAVGGEIGGCPSIEKAVRPGGSGRGETCGPPLYTEPPDGVLIVRS